MKTRTLLLCLLSAAATTAMAGNTTLYAAASAGIDDATTPTTVIAQQQISNTGNFTGLGAFGPTSASAFASDPNFPAPTPADPYAHSVNAFENISANILSETTGNVSFNEGWNTGLGTANQGFVNTMGSSATYSFTTSVPTQLIVDYTSNFAGNFSTPSFGLWNMGLKVDGTSYGTTQEALNTSLGKWVDPLAAGGWKVNLTSGGLHTIEFTSNSNISGGVGTGWQTFNETLNFRTAAAVPEPASFGVMGLGILGLVVRRRTKR